MAALDELTEPLDYAMGVVRHLESVATYPELRAAFNAVQPEVSAFYSGIPLQEGIWNALKKFAATPGRRCLAGARRRFLAKTMDAFRRHGADLDAAGKKRLEEIDVELTTLTTKFARTCSIPPMPLNWCLTDEARLAGLPPSAPSHRRAKAPRARTGKAGVSPCRLPTTSAVMTYLDDASIRRQVYEAYSVRATEGAARQPRVDRADSRIARAKRPACWALPTSPTWCWKTAWRTPAPAPWAFLEDLKTKTEPRFREENRELLEFRRSIEGPARRSLRPGMWAYYAEKQRAALYSFDEEALRPYFPLERVVAGLLTW